MATLDPQQEYTRLMPDLEGLCNGRALLPVNLDIARVATSVLGVLPRIRGFRSALGAAIRSFDGQLFERLERYTAALLQAQALYRATPVLRESPRQQAAELAAKRRILLSQVRALALNGVLDDAPLVHVGRRRGFLGVASDVLLLTTLLEQRWAAVLGRTPLTLSWLQQARRQSVQLLATLGQRRRVPDEFRKAALVRQQIFTLLVRAYDDVRRALRYLRQSERDVDVLMPSLYCARGKEQRRIAPIAGVQDAAFAGQLGAATPTLATSPVRLPAAGALNFEWTAAAEPEQHHELYTCPPRPVSGAPSGLRSGASSRRPLWPPARPRRKMWPSSCRRACSPSRTGWTPSGRALALPPNG